MVAVPDIYYGLKNYKEISQDVSKILGARWEGNYYEIPPRYGKGIVEAYDFGPFSMMLARFKMKSDIRVGRDYSSLEGYYTFDYILNGMSDFQVNELAQRNKEISNLRYGFYISTPSTVSYGDFKGGVQHDQFFILIRRNWLEEFVGKSLPKILNNPNEPLFVYYNLNELLIPSLALLLQTDPMAPLRKQFMHGKCLEIIASSMGILLEDQRNYAPQTFHPDDINLIMQVAESICSQLGEHQTIEDLSRKFNINRDKLQQIFKSVYGKTIAEYSRYLRMNRAYQLLIQRKTVAEVGHELGYANLSHFSKAFKKVHGVNPSVVQKSMLPETG